MIKTDSNQFVSDGGITLIELMVSMAISSVVLLGIIQTFSSQQKSYTTQIQTAMLQQNMRTAMSLILRDIQMGGYYTCIDTNTYASFVDWDPTSAGNDSFQPIIYGQDNISSIANYKDGADIILIVKGSSDRGILIAGESASTGGAAITIADADLDADGDDDLDATDSKFGMLINKDLNRAQLFRVSSAAPGSINTTGTFLYDFTEGATIMRVDILVYRVNDSNTNFSGSVLEINNACDSNGFQPAAEFIDDLQFSYTLSDGTTVTDPAGNETLIRSVAVTLTGSVTIPQVGVKQRQMTASTDVRNMGL